MSPMQMFIGGSVSESATGVGAVLQRIFQFLVPLETTHAASLSQAFLEQLWRMAHSGIVFFLTGLVIYVFSLGRWGRSKLSTFSYSLPVPEPGENFSFSGAAKFLFPKSFYTHPSFKLDLISLPLAIAMGFFGLLGLTLGTGIVQSWLLQRFGHSPVYFPEGVWGNLVQVVIILLARDFGRFMWHYQGHAIPFFWEFHKGHHSIEVLHPLGVRTHPVDMFIRNTYTGVGGGLISGVLIYALGMSVTGTALGWVTLFLAVSALFERFEHSHVRLSFGKTLDRFLYAPYMHHFHHGAGPEHMNVNLGITGGLTLWDKMFGTLYWPKPGEKIVWGPSLEELGERNPLGNLWTFIWVPFVAAAQTLRRRAPVGMGSPGSLESAPTNPA